MTKKILVFTMHKVGSSSMLRGLESEGYEVDRGYEENIDELELKTKLKEYEVIYTAVRDPVARNVSWFFEVNGNRLLQENIRLEHIKDEFLGADFHEYPLHWFDTVFFPLTGLDVYKYDFPTDTGVLILGKVCVLRTEKMLFEWRAKTEESRPYGALYHEFKEWLRLPQWYLDNMYTHKFTRHFFSHDQITEMYEEWL